MTYRAAARLLPQRHGLRRQQRPDRFQGHPRLQRPGATARAPRCSRFLRSRWRSASSSAARIVDLEIRQGAGRDPRRREPHALPRLPRREPTSCSSSRCRPAWPASPARSTCRRSASSIPSEFAPANSIEVVIWVAVGGRGTLIGAVLGAILVNYAKTTFTTGALAPYWLFVLGGLFVARDAVPAAGASSAPSRTGGRDAPRTRGGRSAERRRRRSRGAKPAE